MRNPKFDYGDVILFEDASMRIPHLCIVILFDYDSDCYYLVNTTSQIDRYPIEENYLQKGNARCIDRLNIFLFCQNSFDKHCVVLLKREFISKDFGSNIENSKKLFKLEDNKFSALINCLDRSNDVKKYYKRLIAEQHHSN